MNVPQPICYLSKSPPGKSPWISAGFPSEEDWSLWNQHICGIYCLKMLCDSFFPAHGESLWSLTQRCTELGGFQIQSDSTIRGVFHHPLLMLAKEQHFDGYVEGDLTRAAALAAVRMRRYPLLSIELARVAPSLSGSHLILLHGWDEQGESFVIHDCSDVIARPGEGLVASASFIDRISNRKGLVLWPAAG